MDFYNLPDPIHNTKIDNVATMINKIVIAKNLKNYKNIQLIYCLIFAYL